MHIVVARRAGATESLKLQYKFSHTERSRHDPCAPAKQLCGEAMSRILLVGKEPDLIEVLRLSLEADGHHIMTALDCLEALEMVAGRLPDIVVTDSKTVDAIALCKLQRHAQPGERFRVIRLSDGPQPTDTHASLFDAYVQKPVDVQQLLSLVSQLTIERQNLSSDSDIDMRSR
ncbi:response regulator [Paraburkholderia strydomiana]